MTAPSDGAFAIVAGSIPPLVSFNPGSDEFPENSTTIVAQVERLETGTAITLSGPGIDGVTAIGDPGLPKDFWLQRMELEPLYPCGVDVILTAQHRLACMPRSVQRIDLRTKKPNEESQNPCT